MATYTAPPPPELLDLDNLQAIKLLGKGAMGTVFLVHHKSNDPLARCPFALKVVEKSSLRHTYGRAGHEISVLSRLHNHPFLPYLFGSFENHEIICWAIPFCPGGDLNVLRYSQNDRVFSPAVIRFYLAEIICALEQLHRQGIVYRDLKPENILVQQSGHVMLTDFDLSTDLAPRKPDNLEYYTSPEENSPANLKYTHLAGKFTRFIISKSGKHAFNNNKTGLKKVKSSRVSPVSRKKPDDFPANERSNSFVGTEEYVAPEIIRGAGHEFAVDWWALGVLGYEMLYGTTPFKGKNRKTTFQKILLGQPEFFGKPNPLTDLIRKLLEKEPTRRLGYRRGACEIKEHEFFRGLNWNLLTEVVRPPFLPLRDETSLTQEQVKHGTEINFKEYFHKLKLASSPTWSPSLDECQHNVSLMEF
ncbi:serine/threonine-protein kinase UCNL-like [Olea europaea var. sylvestris]|uniref:non-specific serine/threonine protein kinase n=1 Tax=Olea europaea subsp. europaea TaxID=158383 RepID=A0A8S0UUI9_OLEEU|nr:serine/threonine-protein kinase UCNL-like [Olea europaea var. sylvestris]CAA3021740.1 serine threonine- kinase UCNL-like [Olea europaea subsp. europaea]